MPLKQQHTPNLKMPVAHSVCLKLQVVLYTYTHASYAVQWRGTIYTSESGNCTSRGMDAPASAVSRF